LTGVSIDTKNLQDFSHGGIIRKFGYRTKIYRMKMRTAMDCRKKVKRCVAAIVCMALIIWSGLVCAQGSEDGDTTAQAEDKVYAHVKATSFSSGPFEVYRSM
jgi:hypothetical protein